MAFPADGGRTRARFLPCAGVIQPDSKEDEMPEGGERKSFKRSSSDFTRSLLELF